MAEAVKGRSGRPRDPVGGGIAASCRHRGAFPGREKTTAVRRRTGWTSTSPARPAHGADGSRLNREWLDEDWSWREFDGALMGAGKRKGWAGRDTVR
jgi:hypothetical protein